MPLPSRSSFLPAQPPSVLYNQLHAQCSALKDEYEELNASSSPEYKAALKIVLVEKSHTLQYLAAKMAAELSAKTASIQP
jgi:hypothetical protein